MNRQRAPPVSACGSEIKELFDEYSKRGENPETIEQELKRISQYRESLKKALAYEKKRTV